jgi:lipopolysaccharide transport protein LptA
VHIEFRDAILDAESAQMVFRGEELLSVQVKGSQARFSHQFRQSGRRIHGRADAIDFDGRSGKVRFSGNTWYTDGRHEFSTDLVIYDIDDGSVADDGDTRTRVQGVIRPDLEQDRQRVPPPRIPDRSTAQ